MCDVDNVDVAVVVQASTLVSGRDATAVDTDSNGSGGGLGGGDSPLAVTAAARKKRRSWKQHRVELLPLDVAGAAALRRTHDLYACDQCDKMFGKQSSLARHKYEHSGTSLTHRTLSVDSLARPPGSKDIRG